MKQGLFRLSLMTAILFSLNKDATFENPVTKLLKWSVNGLNVTSNCLKNIKPFEKPALPGN